MSKPPYMRFVPDDYLADTEDLELEELGELRELRCTAVVEDNLKHVSLILGLICHKRMQKIQSRSAKSSLL